MRVCATMVPMTRPQQHQALLDELEANCEHLPLCQVSTDIVIGKGNLDADVMFIGEAPGKNEAEQRTPFVGRAGQLLNATLREHGMERDNFYVSNIVKVRPPENRDPLPNELTAFTPYLQKEIAIIQPLLFVTLGGFSMNFFLPDKKISQVHGVLQRMWWNGEVIYLLPVYHPAAALRSTQMKEAFSQDIAKIPEALEIIKNKKTHDDHVKSVRESLF